MGPIGGARGSYFLVPCKQNNRAHYSNSWLLYGTPLVTWLTLPQPGPRAEDGGNEMARLRLSSALAGRPDGQASLCEQQHLKPAPNAKTTGPCLDVRDYCSRRFHVQSFGHVFSSPNIKLYDQKQQFPVDNAVELYYIR
eukprot:scaffold35760_cov55-Phaeocystis_antarctica.AAC.3